LTAFAEALLAFYNEILTPGWPWKMQPLATPNSEFVIKEDIISKKDLKLLADSYQKWDE